MHSAVQCHHPNKLLFALRDASLSPVCQAVGNSEPLKHEAQLSAMLQCSALPVAQQTADPDASLSTGLTVLNTEVLISMCYDHTAQADLQLVVVEDTHEGSPARCVCAESCMWGWPVVIPLTTIDIEAYDSAVSYLAVSLIASRMIDSWPRCWLHRAGSTKHWSTEHETLCATSILLRQHCRLWLWELHIRVALQNVFMLSDAFEFGCLPCC